MNWRELHIQVHSNSKSNVLFLVLEGCQYQDFYTASDSSPLSKIVLFFKRVCEQVYAVNASADVYLFLLNNINVKKKKKEKRQKFETTL